jgi:hypothetical protein
MTESERRTAGLYVAGTALQGSSLHAMSEQHACERSALDPRSHRTVKTNSPSAEVVPYDSAPSAEARPGERPMAAATDQRPSHAGARTASGKAARADEAPVASIAEKLLERLDRSGSKSRRFRETRLLRPVPAPARAPEPLRTGPRRGNLRAAAEATLEDRGHPDRKRARFDKIVRGVILAEVRA